MKEQAVEALKVSPPAGMLGAWFAGVTINEWAALAALIYTGLLIAEKLYRWLHAWHARPRS